MFTIGTGFGTTEQVSCGQTRGDGKFGTHSESPVTRCNFSVFYPKPFSPNNGVTMASDQSRSWCSQLPCCSACLAEKKTERATLATSTHYKTTYLRWAPFIVRKFIKITTEVPPGIDIHCRRVPKEDNLNYCCPYFVFSKYQYFSLMAQVDFTLGLRSSALCANCTFGHPISEHLLCCCGLH